MCSTIQNRLLTISSLIRLFSQNPASLKMLLKVKRDRLTLLGYGALADLALAVHTIEGNAVPGAFIEAGCALGGSAILIAKTKNKERPLAIYDTFEMIPSPGKEDGQDAQQRYEVIKTGKAQGISIDPYYGYVDDLYNRVKRSFTDASCPIDQNQVTMYKGLIEETMQINQPIAFAHIDCDWFSPVMACLEQIVPHLPPGGILVIDDYYQWSGARKAVDMYFVSKHDQFVFRRKSRLHILKK